MDSLRARFISITREIALRCAPERFRVLRRVSNDFIPRRRSLLPSSSGRRSSRRGLRAPRYKISACASLIVNILISNSNALPVFERAAALSTTREFVIVLASHRGRLLLRDSSRVLYFWEYENFSKKNFQTCGINWFFFCFQTSLVVRLTLRIFLVKKKKLFYFPAQKYFFHSWYSFRQNTFSSQTEVPI